MERDQRDYRGFGPGRDHEGVHPLARRRLVLADRAEEDGKGRGAERRPMAANTRGTFPPTQSPAPKVS